MAGWESRDHTQSPCQGTYPRTRDCGTGRGVVLAPFVWWPQPGAAQPRAENGLLWAGALETEQQAERRTAHPVHARLARR